MSKATNKNPPDIRERAVRVSLKHESRHESRWAAMVSIAGTFGCNSETLRGWVRRAER